MAGKRKRHAHGTEGDHKRQRVSGPSSGKDPVVKHAVLSKYYSQVVSLREYILTKLPASSKIRRKKILSVGRKTPSQSGDAESDRKLSEFLDQTLVGVLKNIDVPQDERWRQWTAFSQRADDSVSTLANLSGTGVFSQTEVGRKSIYLSTFFFCFLFLFCILLLSECYSLTDTEILADHLFRSLTLLYGFSSLRISLQMAVCNISFVKDFERMSTPGQ